MLNKTNISENNARVSVSSLINYIKTNKNQMKSIDIIELSSIQNIEVNEISKLRYQEVKQVLHLPENLNSIFHIEKNKYLHAGVLDNIPLFNDTNISLYSSILVCLKQNFFSQNTPYQQKFVTSLIECLKADSKKNSYRKYNWERDDLYKSISKGFIGVNILKFLCDYFFVNIFVLDIKNDKLMFAGGEYYIPYKKNIFLIHYENDSFEPLYCENSRFFQHTDNIMQEIRNTKNVSVYKLSQNLDFNFIEKEELLEPYLNIKVNKEENKEGNKEENKEEFISLDDIDNMVDKVAVKEDKKDNSKKYTQKELKNMKLQELQEIAKSLDIDITDGKKKKTKEQLIGEIGK